MKIKCTNCGHTEKTDKDFFVKLIGGAMPVGGYWAWTAYLFAGTGFAMAIVVAIIGGGVAMLIFKDEIVEWIINKDYKCPNCGEVKWTAVVGGENSNISKGVKKKYRSQMPIPTIERVESDNKYVIKVDHQKRITIIEELLRSKGYDFERQGDCWIILESSGELKQIGTIDDLEQYVMSL